MNYFPLINSNINSICSRPVNPPSYNCIGLTSIKGRFVCLLHIASTPLKVLSKVGVIALATLNAASRLIGVATLNTHPKELLKVVTALVDIPVGTAFACVALVANLAKAVIGATINPSALINNSYKQSLWQGILKNYR